MRRPKLPLRFGLPALAPDDLWRDRTYLRRWSSILTSAFASQVMMLALPLTAAVLLMRLKAKQLAVGPSDPNCIRSRCPRTTKRLLARTGSWVAPVFDPAGVAKIDFLSLAFLSVCTHRVGTI